MLAKRYLLWCTQDLANLEYGVYFAGSWEERPESVKLSHDAADCPLVYGGAVGRGPEQHLWSSVPGSQATLEPSNPLIEAKPMCFYVFKRNSPSG